MSLTAVTVLKSGGCFSPIWVARLVRQIREYIKPDRIVCLTDMDVKSCEVIPLKHGWPGWFSKIEAFRDGIFGEEEICVYFDLDTLILGPLPDFRDFSGPLAMLTDFYTPAIPASGMMVWEPPPCEAIYRNFAANPRFSKSWREGDGWIIGQYPHHRIQKAFPGLVGSYKADKLQASPKGFSIVCFHGPPKQHELPANSWARKEWERPTE